MSGFYVTVMIVAMVLVGAMGAYNEPDWGFQSYLDEPFTLKCNHSTLIASAYNYVEWQLPSGKTLDRGSEKYELSNEALVANMRLTIQNVQDNDSGVYLCHVYDNDLKQTKRGQLLRGLNLGGPMYRDPFDEYRNNLMVGGLAAVVLFVPLVTACFVYKFRFQTKEQKTAKRAARLEATKHQRHLENNGKGTSAGEELSEVSVNGGKGEINPVYENSSDEIGTRL